ncbi:9336_t:CDS:2 [Dentiscutata erythropus]|uniref:9336_t:CDS:1 n=1 Tax=Dentiscutata erythropus TaxID=1348616 RepID=A0A9N8YSM8_9GLOM|nr:9336_t:CDS:2 [Dentiscutata erythropus]
MRLFINVSFIVQGDAMRIEILLVGCNQVRIWLILDKAGNAPIGGRNGLDRV